MAEPIVVAIFDRVRPMVALVTGLVLGAAITAGVGENPLAVLALLARSAAGSLYDLGMSLFYATPLLFTGLAVALAFRGGLFNIGAEGQLTMGALAAAAVGIMAPQLPSALAIPLALTAAFAGGAVWGAIAGALKAWRNSHEVITTIMLNFIAAAIASYVTLYGLRDTSVQSPESLPVGEGFRLPLLPGFEDAPVSAALPLGVIVTAGVWLLLTRTRSGFRLRAVGANETAASWAAIPVGPVQVLTLALAGGIAGLAGLFDVLGASGRFKLGFSADYGFAGIAVALLARGRPLAVVAAALLFGALHKGAGDLDFETENITRDLGTVLQATVILTVCADAFWDAVRARLRRVGTAAEKRQVVA